MLDVKPEFSLPNIIKTYKNNILYYLQFKMGINYNDAEEIVMDTFLKIDTLKDTYNQKYSLKAWIYKIAINKGIDYLRKEKSRCKNINLESITYDQTYEYATYELFSDESKIIKKYIRQTIRSLPPKYAKVLLLYYYHDYTYNEMSKFLNVPIGTLKARMHKAKKLLKLQLKKNANIFFNKQNKIILNDKNS